MATETVTPNLDAALDASTVIAAGAEAPAIHGEPLRERADSDEEEKRQHPSQNQ